MGFKEIIVLIAAIVFNAFANILLKAGMKNMPKLGDIAANQLAAKTVANPAVWMGLASFGIAFVFYSMVLTKMKLSVAYPIMTSAGFAIVALAGHYLFNEHITLLRLIGIAIIAFGIWIVSSG